MPRDASEDQRIRAWFEGQLSFWQREMAISRPPWLWFSRLMAKWSAGGERFYRERAEKRG
jgi:hypothetical protein